MRHRILKAHRFRPVQEIGFANLKPARANSSVSLKTVTLSGVDLVVSDNHGSLVKAVHTTLKGVITWQRYQTHFMRKYHGR